LGEEKCEMEPVRSHQLQTADNCAVVCKSSGLVRSSVASGHTSSSASVWSLDSIWLDTLRRTCGSGSEAIESYSFVTRRARRGARAMDRGPSRPIAVGRSSYRQIMCADNQQLGAARPHVCSQLSTIRHCDHASIHRVPKRESQTHGGNSVNPSTNFQTFSLPDSPVNLQQSVI